MPPDRKHPTGTSAIMRSRTESRSSGRISSTASSTSGARPPAKAGDQYGSIRVAPSFQRNTCPGGSLRMPAWIVIGAGT